MPGLTQYGQRRHGRLIGQQLDRGPSLNRDEWLDHPCEIRRNQDLARGSQRGEARGVEDDRATNAITPLTRFGGANRNLLGPNGKAQLDARWQTHLVRIAGLDFESSPDCTETVVFVCCRDAKKSDTFVFGKFIQYAAIIFYDGLHAGAQAFQRRFHFDRIQRFEQGIETTDREGNNSDASVFPFWRQAWCRIERNLAGRIVQQQFQILEDCRGIRVTPLGVFVRGALDHCSDAGRKRRHLAGNGFGLDVQDGVNDCLITSAAERPGTA